MKKVEVTMSQVMPGYTGWLLGAVPAIQENREEVGSVSERVIFLNHRSSADHRHRLAVSC